MNFTLASLPLLILSEFCFEEFFIKYNFFHVECIKATVSKVLGLAIVAGSTSVKVPQIVKILKAKSGEGISIFGTSLEIFAMVSQVSYSVANQYPFSSFGDGVFVLTQTAIIGALSLYYAGATGKAVSFFSTIGAALAVLCSGAIPINILWVFQASNIPIVFAGKMIQAYENYKNQSTGQLSGITLAMLFLGTVARIFTSIQETGDTIIILTYIIASLGNGIIFSQLFYYWQSTERKTKEKKKTQ